MQIDILYILMPVIYNDHHKRTDWLGNQPHDQKNFLPVHENLFATAGTIHFEVERETIK